MKLSEMQKAPFDVHVLGKSRANTLIEAGLAKPAEIDPMPESDIPVTLTARGRSATEQTTAPTNQTAPATK